MQIDCANPPSLKFIHAFVPFQVRFFIILLQSKWKKQPPLLVAEMTASFSGALFFDRKF